VYNRRDKIYLTDEQIEQIIFMRNVEKKHLKVIAHLFKCSTTTISRYATGTMKAKTPPKVEKENEELRKDKMPVVNNEAYNPFEAAKKMSVEAGGAKDLLKHCNGVWYYNDKMITGMKVWDLIIRDMNERRIKLGLHQFTGKDCWVHKN
jgi:hypothetical protein